MQERRREIEIYKFIASPVKGDAMRFQCEGYEVKTGSTILYNVTLEDSPVTYDEIILIHEHYFFFTVTEIEY